MHTKHQNAEKLRYLGTTITDQNHTHDEIKGRLNSRKVWYSSVQNPLLLRSTFICKDELNILEVYITTRIGIN
jgi:hypothetical protein